jgi:PAS domain-containing protein
MAQGLALFDAEDRLLVANRRALTLLRLSPEAAAPGAAWRELTRAVMRAAGHPEAEAAALAHDRIRFAAAAPRARGCGKRRTGRWSPFPFRPPPTGASSPLGKT